MNSGLRSHAAISVHLKKSGLTNGDNAPGEALLFCLTHSRNSVQKQTNNYSFAKIDDA